MGNKALSRVQETGPQLKKRAEAPVPVPSFDRMIHGLRLGILTIALMYVLSLAVGAGMVHAGNRFALAQRDSLIARARASDPSLSALRADHRLSAALWDTRSNLLAAIVDTVLGLGVVFPYPDVAYRGWVGGIVSVDAAHASRLSDSREAGYYLLTLLLQLIPYSLAGGVGVNLGLAYLRPRPVYQGTRWLGLPREALMDVLRVYLLIVPLFLIASLWEFLAR
jgi:hypothetical protein